MSSISLNQKALSNFQETIGKEWIIANGLGGYASSTVLGINTRKYHGMLVSTFNPPGKRMVCLAKLDEEISIGNSTYPLGANEFQDCIFPEGHLLLKEFSLSPFPKYTYAINDVEVQKTIVMPREKNVTIALYNIFNGSGFDIKIRVFPLINLRHFHSVTDRWKVSWQLAQKYEDKEVRMRFNNPQSILIMKTTDGQYQVAEKWVENIYYREEAVRGESCLDDCYQPGYFELSVKANKSEKFAITALADKSDADVLKVLTKMPFSIYDIEALYEREIKSRKDFLARFYETHERLSATDWLNWIVQATDMFVVRGMDYAQKAVIAGYHWFGVWGRDTFISLPGLLLVTGRFEDARKVFGIFKACCEQGLIPNFFPEKDEHPVYNAVDATLWYVNAILQYLKYTGDFKFVQEHLWETLKAIIENHIKGTMYNIRVDSDGLLMHNSRLTWMDAVVDGQPVTPRAGKAVEVQALWYNTLKTAEFLAKRFNEKGEAERIAQMAEKARKSFVEKFWNKEKNCLFDVVSEYGNDQSLRPNQIIAVALDFAMLADAKNEGIVDAVHRELLTPYGLRTLARGDPKYVGVYAGDRRSRDKVYHNGTVWPWLLGSFTTAFLKAKGYTEYRREHALNFLRPLFTEQEYKAGLGTISEIFDGESPHTPRGCIAQAWSIAEPLRAYIEDIMQIRPKHEREIVQSSR